MKVGHLRLKTDTRLTTPVRWIAWVDVEGRPVFGASETPTAAAAQAYERAADVVEARTERPALVGDHLLTPSGLVVLHPDAIGDGRVWGREGAAQ